MVNRNSFFRTLALVVALGLSLGLGLGIAGRGDAVRAAADGGPGGITAANQNGETGMETAVSQGQFYERVTGTSFRPNHYIYDFGNGGNGCLIAYQSGANPHHYTYELQLPHSATINYMRLFYNDNSISSNLTVSLLRSNNAGVLSLIDSVSSTGWNGYGSTINNTLSLTIDNTAYSYILSAAMPDGLSTALQLCGVSIGWQFTLAANYLPSMLHLAGP